MPSSNQERLKPKPWNERGRDARDRQSEVEDFLTTTTLTELCEPFFLEVCGVIRSTEKGGDRQAWEVHDRLKRKLDALLEQAKNDYAWLAEDYRYIEPVLAYFADVVIQDSKLPYARQWEGQLLLANAPRISSKTGRQEFFDLLAATLCKSGNRAAQQLAIFQTCLGLGFGGAYHDNPAKLRQLSDEILQTLERNAETDPRRGKRRERICNEAYEHTQMEELCRPMAEKIWVIGIICCALLLATVVAYVSIYIDARDEIQRALGGIITSAN